MKQVFKVVKLGKTNTEVFEAESNQKAINHIRTLPHGIYTVQTCFVVPAKKKEKEENAE